MYICFVDIALYFANFVILGFFRETFPRVYISIFMKT